MDLFMTITKEELADLSIKKLMVDRDLINAPKKIFNKIKENIEINDFELLSILAALNAGFHIILYGPPGTAKSTLSLLIPKLVYRAMPDMNTADSDWNVKRAIGGRDIEYVKEPSGIEIKEIITPIAGCITSSILSCYRNLYLTEEYIATFSIIDEFNRTDMDACIGPLFTAMVSENKTLKLPYNKGFNAHLEEIIIPNNFRIICSMNKYDRTFTTELSEALTRRFKWIYIGYPSDSSRENDIILKKLQNSTSPVITLPTDLVEVPDFKLINYLKETVFDKINAIINQVRVYLPLGTAFLLDSYKMAFHYFIIKKGFILEHPSISTLGFTVSEIQDIHDGLNDSDSELQELVDKIADVSKKAAFTSILNEVFEEVVDASLCTTVLPACESLEDRNSIEEVRSILQNYKNCLAEFNRMNIE